MVCSKKLFSVIPKSPVIVFVEHIWWDQATALRQAGILPSHLPYSGTGGGTLRLPIAGAECAEMLLDERNGKSNEMMGDDWGVQKP